MRLIGILAGVIASTIFGATEVMSKMVFDMGMNEMMLITLRNLMAVPVLYAVMRAKHIPLRVTKKEFMPLLGLILIGFSPACMLLFAAYNYIPVGHVTLLHYMYPAITVVLETLIFREKVSRGKWISVVVCTLGVFCFVPKTSGGLQDTAMIGCIMAIASGLFYAIYLLGFEHSVIQNIHPLKLSVYLCLLGSIQPAIYVFTHGPVTLDYPPRAWAYLIIITLLYSVIGFSCLQLSLRYIGAVVASVICTLEPITAFLMGVWVLDEPFGWVTILGCVLIAGAVIMIALDGREKSEATQKIG